MLPGPCSHSRAALLEVTSVTLTWPKKRSAVGNKMKIVYWQRPCDIQGGENTHTKKKEDAVNLSLCLYLLNDMPDLFLDNREMLAGCI